MFLQFPSVSAGKSKQKNVFPSVLMFCQNPVNLDQVDHSAERCGN